ncbi:hypothetical protein [Rhodoferax sp. OV413]|uniref:hypothetical protein n=1 Tax=Rhodoferax sp. OV413 TaxID=1855285 RepID=UPI0025EF8E14|nr:hypothetical protein [Rhodoferax sp. OV413]
MTLVRPAQAAALQRARLLNRLAVLGVVCALGACSMTKPTPPAQPPVVQAPAPVQPPAPVAIIEPVPAQEPAPAFFSKAATPRDYRRDAANHLYARNANRIYAGKLPPLLYAVGVLDVDIDPRGQVTDVRWLRAPRHAPEVMADIERSVRAAAPYPAPVRMGRVTYTETWLWHKSGRFQLDTLTEGQM